MTRAKVDEEGKIILLTADNKSGYRAYDDILISIVKDIASFESREYISRVFCDDIWNLSSCHHICMMDFYGEEIKDIKELDIFYYKMGRGDNQEITTKRGDSQEYLENIRNKQYLELLKEEGFDFSILNSIMNQKEKNISWGSRWSKLSFVRRFVSKREYRREGWLNIVYLRRATTRHPHRFLALWYPMTSERRLPESYIQDERALYFFRNLYNLASYAIRAKAKKVYEQKISLINDIAPSVINHEILTNLSQPIYTFEAIIPKIEDEKIKSIIERNVRMLKRTKEIADSLLRLTKRAKDAEIEICAMFERIHELSKNITARDSAEIELLCPEREIVLINDEGLLMQILINLISNALEAYKERDKADRSIYLIARNLEERVELIVADNAGGIEDKIADRIFEQGFTTKKSSGHGLGLTISRYIADFLGGKLTLHSPWGEYDTAFILSLSIEHTLESEIEEEVIL